MQIARFLSSVCVASVLFAFNYAAHAAGPNPVGQYKYAQKGFGGQMKISEVSECEVNPKKIGCMSSRILMMELTSVASDGSDCDLKAYENAAGRMASGGNLEALFAAVKDDKSVTTFSVVFGKNGAVVQKIERGDLVGICGMRGSFLGKWVKSAK